MLSALTLGCAPGPRRSAPTPGSPRATPPRAGAPSTARTSSPPAPAGTVGDPVEPGTGASAPQPTDLGVGAVRLVWSSTVSGVHLDWVAPAVPEARRLWLLRTADSGRCVVGVWSSAQLGFEVVRHVFRNEDRLEIVLLGLGPPPRLGWMVLVTDGSQLWSGLYSRDTRPVPWSPSRWSSGRKQIAFVSWSWMGGDRPSSTSMADSSSAGPSPTPADPKSG